MLTTMNIPLLSILVLLFLYLCRNKQSGSEKKRPPFPLGLPIIGSLHQLGSLPHRSLAHLAKIYGSLMHRKLGRVPILVVSSPKMAELVMKTYDHAFCSRPILVPTNYLTNGSTNVAFAPYGSYWCHVRKICILELLSSKRVQSFRFVRKEEVGRLVDSILVYWEEEPELREIFESSKSFIGGFFVGDFFPSLEWEEEEEKDLVDVLLQLQKEGTLISPSLQITSKLLLWQDMFAAGTDTTATTLVWGMSVLMKNQLAMKKAKDEVHRIAKSNNTNMIEERLTPILQLHPPTPLLIPRKSVEDCDIEGYFIPSKTRVLLNAWAIGRQPDNWVDPEVFRLERFIGSDIDYKGQDFALIPFGAGRRGCPAISFAASVIELALANLLLCFDWALPNGMNHKDLDMTEDSGLTVHKKTLCY
ncbi:hypothetical protein AMTRI_Chr06g198680 [Amborella trichopoda]